MNANTALKINDAIDQAIRCGESVEAVQLQVRNALARAVEQRAAIDREAALTKALGIKPGETLRIEISEDIA